MNTLRKQSILEKLAKRAGRDDVGRLARKGEGWDRAARVARYGGLGAMGASFLTPSPTSGRLAAGGIAAMLGSMVASDLARGKRSKARRKLMEKMVAERKNR